MWEAHNRRLLSPSLAPLLSSLPSLRLLFSSSSVISRSFAHTPSDPVQHSTSGWRHSSSGALAADRKGNTGDYSEHRGSGDGPGASGRSRSCGRPGDGDRLPSCAARELRLAASQNLAKTRSDSWERVQLEEGKDTGKRSVYALSALVEGQRNGWLTQTSA